MKILRITPFFLTLFFTLFIYSQENNFSVTEIPEELKKNANSVIRVENVSIDIKSQREMIINYETAITIFNKLADNFANITVHYDNKRSINGVKAYIYDANGEEIKKIKKSEFKDYSAYDGISLHNDGRLIHYEHTAITYPYTVYYKYEIKTSNTGFIPSWNPIDRYSTSVIHSSYSVNSNQGLKLRIKEKSFEGYNISINNSDYNLGYEISNQEAIKYEPYSPELEKFTPKLFVGLNKYSLEGVNGEANNWKEFGKWRYEYLKNGNDKIDENVKLQIIELVKGVIDPIEKAKIIYEYVQNKTRYISVQEGIGGWIPINANEVHQLGYGDCKGLTNYTKTLLDAVGVKSHYSVIWAGEENKNVEKDFFSMQGNHIILNLPTDKGDLWLECTNQKMPFGHIGSFTADRDVLVVTPEGGIIKHTKIYKTEENCQLTKGTYEVNELGEITAKVSIDASGTQYDNHLFRYDGESQKNLDLLFKKYFSNINNIEFSKIEVLNNKREFKFEELLEFNASNYATFSGNQLLIVINAFNRNLSVPKRIRNRILPLQISSGFLDIDEVQIKLPKSLKLEYMPEDVELNSKFGKYSIEIEKIDDYNYIYKRKLQIEEGRYPKEDYTAYRDFRKKIRKFDNSKIILVK
ncbi:DUF3857 domain-containing protein [Lutibacter flavus]|uniref:DUF3857 domain-containing protein n=1 Tax=Lutibacter flavus TaxID=691689 RepID=A0A238YTB4_9FLAO|nr:DUF3857 domain-containing protein [Lutibacter flavus]SNR74182.1 protein of unknown function [Lutibacter flavus]